MKQAKVVAQQRIDAIRAEQESLFQKEMNAKEGSGNLDTENINVQTDKKIQMLRSSVETNRDDVSYVQCSICLTFIKICLGFKTKK